MHDVNDLLYFAKVVRHRGFSSAARALHLSKSALSKRVSRLEAQLQTRLVERSGRSFRVTAVGREIYAQCEAIVAGVNAATQIARTATAHPRGAVRFACPPGMMFAAVSALIPTFLQAYPEVQLCVAVSNRRVELIDSGFDVAMRIRDKLDSDADYVVRKIGHSRRIFVASPQCAGEIASPGRIGELARCSILSLAEDIRAERWTLLSGEKEVHIEVLPRFATSEFSALLEAAIAGAGVALLPTVICRDALADGRLMQVFPEWHSRDSIVHLVYPTRRGLPPATRVFIDFLAARLSPLFAHPGNIAVRKNQHSAEA